MSRVRLDGRVSRKSLRCRVIKLIFMKNDNDKIKKEEVKEHEESRKDDGNKTDEEIEKLKKKAEDFENNYKRALADYQNLQKRTVDERINLIKSANKELLLRLLPVLDTLLLANQHINNEGLKVSIDQFLDALKAEGVTRIEALGKEFDPNLMECIKVGDGEENKVLEVLRVGYIINDKVLRPAQVIVGSGKQNASN